MPNIKLTLAYDGTNYLGWQKTSMGPSVEAALEAALFQILREKIDLQAASRTDAGVHANGQVVNFLMQKEDFDLGKLHRSLNAVLPDDISLLQIEQADNSFHPTLDNVGKEYHYFLCNTKAQLPFHRKFSWHWPYPLDRALMQQAAALLPGTHDFGAFCNERSVFTRDPVCRLDLIEVSYPEEERLCFRIIGNRFLYKMVRNLVGTLVYIGCGKIPLSDLEKILENKQRSLAGLTAPARGLHLKQVFYPLEKTPKHLCSIHLVETIRPKKLESL